MTNRELRASLKTLGITQRWLAERLGVKPSTVWRWLIGECPVPQYVVFVLELIHELRRD